MRKWIAIVAMLLAVVLVGCSEPQPQADTAEPTTPKQTKLEPKELDEYTWRELAKISKKIATADGEEAARKVAKKYNIVEDDGSLTTATKQIVIDGTRALDVRVAGIRHDDKSDGSGKAGLTFMTVGAVDIRPMNDEAKIEGGWRDSSLRAWLSSTMRKRLEKALRKVLVPVEKRTNNVGFTLDVEDVSATSDGLWVFSAREVCGDIHWDLDEYRQKMGYQDVDSILNAEGSQYEAFAQAGVTSTADPNGYLSLADTTGASPWWYRTAYPFEWFGYGETGNTGYFCQVNQAGYPESLGSPEVPASVVVGFCV